MADKEKSIDKTSSEDSNTSQEPKKQPALGTGKHDNTNEFFRRYDSDTNRVDNGRHNYNLKQDSGLDVIINSKITAKDVRDRLWINRDFEISHLWQRSIFLNTLLILCFTGYGVTVMALVNVLSEKGVDATTYTINNILLVICLVSVIFSCFCIMMAKGSKAWYEKYENAIDAFEDNEDYMSEAVLYSGELYEERNEKKDVKKQVGIGGFRCREIKGYKPVNIKDGLFYCKAGAYSPSRINIAIGQIALVLWCLAFIIHLVMSFVGFEMPERMYTKVIPMVLMIAFMIVLVCSIWLATTKKNKWVKSNCLLKEKEMKKEEENSEDTKKVYETKKNDNFISWMKSKYSVSIFCSILLAIFLAGIPAYLYFNKFGFVLPADRTECGIMGDFLSGTTNSILNFFTLVFSLIAVYISIRISYKIQNRNEDMLQIQNKPIPFVNLRKSSDMLAVDIQNMGVGSMITTNLKLVKKKGDKEISYPHFRELMENEGILKVPEIIYSYNTCPEFALAPSVGSVNILKIELFSSPSIAPSQIERIKGIIGEYTLEFEYKDVFDRIASHKKKLSFFKS